MWHNATHGKDEALRLIYSFVETLPIAPPSEAIRAEVEQAVTQLIEATRTGKEVQRLMLDWLRTEFEVLEPGSRLENFAALDVQAFVEEVRRRRAKTARKLTPAALKDLRAGYVEQATPVQQYRAEASLLERKLSDLVNAAYGLSAEEIALLWSTAPPRMPLPPPTAPAQ